MKKLNTHNVDLLISAVSKKQYPEHEKPEVAMCGRSNVGKSSFINTILERKNYARVSSKPGKTRTLNFFDVNDQVVLVDVPGYGYAKLSKPEKEKLYDMIVEYFTNSENLGFVLHLIDSRHKPSDNDIMMYEWIVSQGVTPIIVATKTDKLKRSQIKGQMELIMKTLNLTSKEQLLPFSSETKVGVNELWEIIEAIYPEQES